ncbi:MAG: AAA+-type ATPase [Caeruleum heppii]|nr:MAG: AAA+-type ATPase [Caeruleum heppii]
MSNLATYSVRPLPRDPAKVDLRIAFRLLLSRSALLLHKLQSGEPCRLYRDGQFVGCALAWPGEDGVDDKVAQTSRVLQKAYGLSLRDKLTIERCDQPLQAATKISLRDVSDDKLAPVLPEADVEHWTWFLELPISNAEVVVPRMVFEQVALKGQRRSFRVDQIDDGQRHIACHQQKTKIEIITGLALNGSLPLAILRLPSADIAGLYPQVETINKVLEDFQNEQLPYSWLRRPHGLLLYGAPGTGKTMLLERMATMSWGHVLRMDTTLGMRSVSDAVATVRKTFAEARTYQRCLVIIDQLDLVTCKEAGHDGSLNVASLLIREFDSLASEGSSSQIFVAGATNRLSAIDDALRRHGRFGRGIELPVPDASAREKILKSLLHVPRSEDDKLITRLAERTHAYVGADLDELVQAAGLEAAARIDNVPDSLADSLQEIEFDEDGQITGQSEHLEDNHKLPSQADFDRAMLQVRPTAMREIFLEVPKVQWSDIGGQDHVKHSLKAAIERPLKNPERMRRLGIVPKKGLLLYGPPGCSKTLTAQALATEAGFNFLAVKGAELLSMYVGESERALREVFRKARAASPSVIFFDEIDALASSRDLSRSSGLNVLTSLLNEMDGIETLKGVMVLAATNKPELLDPALMRPGRLDTILYVGPPDLKARKDILRKHLAKMDTAADVSVDVLASRTLGHSGAEMVSICQVAGDYAYDESEEQGVELPVSAKHFADAMLHVPRQITPEMRRSTTTTSLTYSFPHPLPDPLRSPTTIRSIAVAVPHAPTIHLSTLALAFSKPHAFPGGADQRPTSQWAAAAARSTESVAEPQSRSSRFEESQSKSGTDAEEIVVEKLTKNVNEHHLREIFSAYGTIRDVDLPMNRQFNTNRGTAYILFSTTPSAEAAIAHMHESQLDGAVINVSIVLPRRKFASPPPPARRPLFGGGPPPGAGYRGGPPPGPSGPRDRSPPGRGYGRRSPPPPRRYGGPPRGGGGGGGGIGRDDTYRPRSYTRSRSRSPISRRSRSPSYSSRSYSRSPPPRRRYGGGGGGGGGGSGRGGSSGGGGGGGYRRRRSPSYSSYSSYSDRSRSRSRGRGPPRGRR